MGGWIEGKRKFDGKRRKKNFSPVGGQIGTFKL